MSKSVLATKTILSPNHSGQRAYKVTRITPHCMVGQMPAESCGRLFAKESYQASSNYGIGKDGEIALYVDENNRSWCSSSADNDNRAVTIECASDTKAPYALNSGVYASLVKLCTDICKRYGKSTLLWLRDKTTALAYKPKDDEMVITAHRWFAAKSCPGDWLYSRLGTLAKEVTAQLSGMPKSGEVQKEAPNTAAAIKINNEEADREKKIWDFLTEGKGLSGLAAAGLMGNLYAESALRPNNLQNSFERRLKMTDKSYTTAVNIGTYKNFVSDGAGYGLAQWTWHTRKAALLDYARKHAKSIDDLQMQMEFLWSELQGYSKSMEALRAGTSIKTVSDAILTDFEKPADQSAAVKKSRAELGREIYNRQATKPTFCVQFGAFRQEARAKEMQERTKEKGFGTIVIKTEGLHLVQTERDFESESLAAAAACLAQKAGFAAIIKHRGV